MDECLNEVCVGYEEKTKMEKQSKPVTMTSGNALGGTLLIVLGFSTVHFLESVQLQSKRNRQLFIQEVVK
jgi:hypothetical protein